MSFNPDPTKKAQEVIFSCKNKKNHSTLHLISTIQMSNKLPFKKHLGLILDSQLSFEKHFDRKKTKQNKKNHLKTVSSKVNKTIRLIRKLRNYLARPSLMILYKSLY